MLINVIVVIAFIIIAIVNLVSESQDSEGIYGIKPLLMPLLALYYVINAAEHNWFIVFALICSFFGDIFLLWPEYKSFYLSGFSFYFIGHLIYTVVFLNDSSFFAGINNSFFLLLIPYLIGIIFFFRRVCPKTKKYIIPLVIYLFTIVLMNFSALGRYRAFDGLSFYLPFVGSLLFIFSDALYIYQTCKGKSSLREIWMISSYILGQLMIVFGYLI